MANNEAASKVNSLIDIDYKSGDMQFGTTDGQEIIISSEVQRKISKHVRAQDLKEMLRQNEYISSIIEPLYRSDREELLDMLVCYAAIHIDDIESNLSDQICQLAMSSYYGEVDRRSDLDPDYLYCDLDDLI